jgi:hypothetical protein
MKTLSIALMSMTLLAVTSCLCLRDSPVPHNRTLRFCERFCSEEYYFCVDQQHEHEQCVREYHQCIGNCEQ